MFSDTRVVIAGNASLAIEMIFLSHLKAQIKSVDQEFIV